MKKKRIKTNVLIAIWLILMELLGLIARIDNNIISVFYMITLALLGNKIRKRLGIEVM